MYVYEYINICIFVCMFHLGYTAICPVPADFTSRLHGTLSLIIAGQGLN